MLPQAPSDYQGRGWKVLFMPSIEQSLNERGSVVFLDRGKIWQNDLRCPPSFQALQVGRHFIRGDIFGRDRF